MIELDAQDCWRAKIGDVEMGCALRADDLPPAAETRSLKQVHGAEIFSDQDTHTETTEGDGLVSDQARVNLVIRTADCVPVHVTDGQRIAALHAGWRGTAKGIVRRLPEFFQMDRITVVLGPAITQDNYEVGPDLYDPWLAQEPVLSRYLQHPNPNSDRRFLDVRGLIQHQLETMGVPKTQIHVVPRCTFDSRLPSYRREGAAASRILNYIMRD